MKPVATFSGSGDVSSRESRCAGGAHLVARSGHWVSATVAYHRGKHGETDVSLQSCSCGIMPYCESRHLSVCASFERACSSVNCTKGLVTCSRAKTSLQT